MSAGKSDWYNWNPGCYIGSKIGHGIANFGKDIYHGDWDSVAYKAGGASVGIAEAGVASWASKAVAGKMVAGAESKNPLAKIKYTDKVKAQAIQADYHGFPECVDSFGANGKVGSITGGDGIIRTKVEIAGNYMGKDGVFQYILEPDEITCNHRLFVPNK